jgi:hypothetical protein
VILWHVTEKLFGFGKKKAIRAELERLSKAWNEANKVLSVSGGRGEQK